MEEMNLDKLGVKGYVRFSIKADDTPENNSVHDAFKEFCKTETDNNYTQGIRKLLEYYQGDFKYEAIWEAIKELQNGIQMLKQETKEKEVEEGNKF